MSMSSSIGFVLKVIALSGGIGLAIKAIALALAPAPSLGLVIGLLLAPSVLMAGLLWLQSIAEPPDSLP